MRQADPHSGFTLIELMVTVAVLAILATIALPSFEGTLRRNRLATATNELIASFSLARSEAIRRNYAFNSDQDIVLCASIDGTACDGTSWSGGWLVASRSDDLVDEVLRYVQGPNKITVAANAMTLFEFDNRGRLSGGIEDFSLRPSECPTGEALVRTLRVNGTGQIRAEHGACP